MAYLKKGQDGSEGAEKMHFLAELLISQMMSVGLSRRSSVPIEE